jgi:hypothetical protein
MPLYHLLLEASAFHERIRPALAAAWRRRSFDPCRLLCEALIPAALAFSRRHHIGGEPLLCRVACGLRFERGLWRHVVGEVLWFSAAEIPELQTAPDTLCCLLAPERYREGPAPRERFAPVEQVHFGARDLTFGGGYYRPEHAGYNDRADVARLVDYLASLDPGRWTADQLAPLEGMGGEEDRAEELDFVRDWFGPLRDLYARARQEDRIIVCEQL